MPIDVDATIAGLQALAHRVDEATERIVSRVAHTFQALSMANAPVGEEGNSTNTPGDLQRSIEVDGPHGGRGLYTARVGPTVVTDNPGRGGTVFNYGRQREFGGEIFPVAGPYLVFRGKQGWAQKTSVFQVGSYYLTRARAEGGGEIDVIVDDELTAAVEGA